MKTFHIHIQGIVQGVGFRPFVYKMALKNGVKGWVNNTNDGVHIEITDTAAKAENFLQELLDFLPPLAIVTEYSIHKVEFKEFADFKIIESTDSTKPKLLLTPDVALCEDCRKELYDSENRRFQYPFSTCTNCGPRYSIIEKLPYDRPNTTMKSFKMCPTCETEYNNPLERRHFSQTNSCPDCKVEMQLFSEGKIIENFEDLDFIVETWKRGKIIAIKGIGGYLLTCDATNAEAVENLRTRKFRPAKPFALMYPSIEILEKDVLLQKNEKEELQSISAPIVLLETREKIHSDLALQSVNKGLSRIGVMLPYTPLMDILLNRFGKPIVATSGNISNSTIIFGDEKAVDELSKIADLLLMNNREITVPQDDGVVQFSKKYHQKITLRRSRGKAPVYINPNLKTPEKSIFASGAMLKSVFGFLHEKNVYISQYLGNTESYDAQLNYQTTFDHLQNIFQIRFDKVVTDKHPDYFSTRFGKELSIKNQSEVIEIQHHKAHFWSVLGENNLLECEEPVLGVVWDGTGLGDDGNIWGGEFFMHKNTQMERVWHLDEFPFILGDKMPKEPRISAFAIFQGNATSNKFLKPKFTDTEWNIYQKMVTQTSLKSTSLGRLFDAVSSLLFEYDVHSFEAEASMQLENRASQYYYNHTVSFENSYLIKEDLPVNFLAFITQNIVDDLLKETDKQLIAVKFHLTLADYIKLVAEKFNAKSLAFSGGVFQNALLVDLIIEKLQSDYQLYFHKEFSPNDEGIAFGQIVSSFKTFE